MSRNSYETFSHFTVADKGYKTPCWLWKGVLTENGYGRHKRGLKHVRVHKLYYEKYVGPVPDKLELDHLCHVRHCVNPDHLEPVTHTVNMQRASHCKLTMEKAEEIRTLSKAGYSVMHLATRFNVKKVSIREILRSSAWVKQEQP